MLLTNRDNEILRVLTHNVRVLSRGQIARTWWPNSVRGAQPRLRQLADEGLLLIELLPAHPELSLQAPVFSWRPNDPAPPIGEAVYKLQSRWREHPVLTECISASKKAVNRLGGHGGRLPRTVERTHDLHLARVYLIYRSEQADLLPFWIFEERIKAERRRQPRVHGEKLPDVVVRAPGAHKVVEFGGAYGPDKVTAFHEYCKERSLAYELW